MIDLLNFCVGLIFHSVAQEVFFAYSPSFSTQPSFCGFKKVRDDSYFYS
jgi:hypothetical protein